MEITKMQLVITIICTLVGSAGIFGFVQFLIERNDKKKGYAKMLVDKLDTISEKVDKLEGRMTCDELDTTRIQLLVLIKDYPDDRESILKVAQKYFDVLHGDWYVTHIFNMWCAEHDTKPEWFDANK